MSRKRCKDIPVRPWMSRGPVRQYACVVLPDRSTRGLIHFVEGRRGAKGERDEADHGRASVRGRVLTAGNTRLPETRIEARARLAARRSAPAASGASPRSRPWARLRPCSPRSAPPSLHVDHSAWQAALRTPIEPETDDEREAVAEAMASGVLIPGAQISAEIATRRSRLEH
jgi:hypothetical protein